MRQDEIISGEEKGVDVEGGAEEYFPLTGYAIDKPPMFLAGAQDQRMKRSIEQQGSL